MKKEKSCGAIVFDNDKVLVIQHILGHWDLPKGHIENNETEIETAIREVKEETNIDIKVKDEYRYTMEYSPEENVWKEVVYFVATKIEGEIIPQEEEVSKVEWLNCYDALHRLTFDNAKEILQKAIKDFYEKE